MNAKEHFEDWAGELIGAFIWAGKERGLTKAEMNAEGTRCASLIWQKLSEAPEIQTGDKNGSSLQR